MPATCLRNNATSFLWQYSVTQVNEVAGPMGMFFSGLVSNPGSVLTVDIPLELQNAELAAQRYLEYVRGARTLSPQELGVVASSLARARVSTTRATPGAGRFWGLVDTADQLAATRPTLPPVGLAPPPPPLISKQPVRPPTVYPGWWRGANGFQGCVEELLQVVSMTVWDGIPTKYGMPPPQIPAPPSSPADAVRALCHDAWKLA